MKILKLRLRGAIGIKKGLGIDEIEINFEQFQKGLIALTGRNGSGKTTIMENLHPYRCMVSRSGSLQSHFFLKDSYRALDFEHNGKEYRSKILIDALTGGSEAYLLELRDNTTFALNDGKLTTYDEAIENLLGSQELFFNSVFSGQKSKGIAELKPADRRKLFYELLNLNIYEGYLEKAKVKLKFNELKLAEIEGNIRAIDISDATKNELESNRIDLLNSQAALTGAISNMENDIESINKKIRSLEIELSKSQDKLKANEEIECKVESIKNKVTDITYSYNSKISQYNSEILVFEKLIDRSKKLTENKDKINSILSEKKEVETRIVKFKDEIAQLQTEYSIHQSRYSDSIKGISQQSSELSKEQIAFQKLESELADVERDIQRIEAETNIINDAPCDSETGSSCKFLSNAHKSKLMLPALKDKRDLLSFHISEKKNFIDEMHSKLNSKKQVIEEQFQINTSEIKKKMNEVDLFISKQETRLNEIKRDDWDKLKEDAENAENQIKLHEQKIESTEKSIEESKQTFDSAMDDLKAQVDELQIKLDVELPFKIDGLKQNLSGEKSQLERVKSKLQTTKDDLETTKRALAGVEEEQKQLLKNEEKVAELMTQKQSIQKEITEWTFLQKAFDKTGIPVLKLENSGIEITSIANELLSLFENKFRIVFETTSLTKDKKKMKETFDINIVEEDGVCEIGNKSGGQQVWLETAIQLAISLVVRNQGRNIQTSFLDEKDGALDLENAYSYIEMLRKAHEMSGVHNTFVITHRTELLDFIPQQVKLSDGYLQILN